MKNLAIILGAAVLLGTAGLPAQSQLADDRAGALRQLNTGVLRLHEQTQLERAAGRSVDRREGQTLIRQRAQALLELMRVDPDEALKVELPAEVINGLRAEFPEAASWLEESGEWSGTVQVEILDDFEHETSQTDIRLRRDGEEVVLHFADGTAPQVQCSETMSVEGMRLGGEVAVRGFVRAAGTAEAVGCTPIGPQQTLVILAKFPGYADTFSTSHANSVVFADGGSRSLNTYFKEASAGAASVTGTVVGWLTLDKLYTCTDYVNMRLAALRAADPLVDLTQFSRIVIFFPNPGSCSFGGVSTVGCTSISTSRGTSLASLSMLVADYTTTVDRAVQLASHEVGHGLGLYHSASRDFGAEPVGTLGLAGTVSTYGDNFSAMGYWNLGHYAAPQKLSLGWWGWGTQAQTVQSAGTYVITPAELASTAPQALKVQRGTGNNAWLWLEYRQPTGLFDTALPSQVYSGVLIHYEDSTNGGLTHLLDYSPGSANWNGPALPAGSVWKDPYTNLTVSVLGANSAGATVSVSYGAEECSRQAPTLSVSPSTTTIIAGQGASYSVTLKNNDSASCTASTFGLQHSVPQGWTGSVSPSSSALAPGQSVTGQLSVTSPTSATGSYIVGTTADDSTRTTTATAGISVSAPAQPTVTEPMTIALQTNNAAPTTKTKLTFTATVAKGSAVQSGAPVSLVLKRPDGSQSTYTITTNSSGVATLSLFLRRTGAYSAVATASDAGTIVQSPTLSITVK